MELITRIWRAIYQRSLSSSPLKVVIFFALILLFLLLLIYANRRRKIREQRLLNQAYREKWDYYTRRYEINSEEAEFLEKLARELKNPAKKYALLVDKHIFNAALKRHLSREPGGEEIARSIMLKAGLKPVSEEMKGIAVQRRRERRKSVDIEARVEGLEPGSRPYRARIYDVSSRGAAAENPEKVFSAGEDIRVSFDFNQKRYKNIPAEVVRLSTGGTRMHLSFEHLAFKHLV